ncbi:hypothetical protein [Caulobacter sp.]|uniref:hypothetical protein n=1 Tax=Caulobacter sp. TaxID=78 RepID=UPI003BAB572D
MGDEIAQALIGAVGAFGGAMLAGWVTSQITRNTLLVDTVATERAEWRAPARGGGGCQPLGRSLVVRATVSAPIQGQSYTRPPDAIVKSGFACRPPLGLPLCYQSQFFGYTTGHGPHGNLPLADQGAGGEDQLGLGRKRDGDRFF